LNPAALKIKPAEYARRRKQLMRMAGEDAILILPAAPERIRSKDTTYPYRQDSDFWYLTGFQEPEAVLVLVPGRKHGESLLFCRERDPEREAWDGPRAGQDGAVSEFGMDDAYPIADLDEILPGRVMRVAAADALRRGRQDQDGVFAGHAHQLLAAACVGLGGHSGVAGHRDVVRFN